MNAEQQKFLRVDVQKAIACLDKENFVGSDLLLYLPTHYTRYHVGQILWRMWMAGLIDRIELSNYKATGFKSETIYKVKK